MTEHWALELHGQDGSTWPIQGAGSGPGGSGVQLLPNTQQFYHSPAVTYWVDSGGALQEYQGFSYKRRDPLFGLWTEDDDPEDWRALWSELSMAFGDPDDTFKLKSITTDGDRWLDMRLLEHLGAFEPAEGAQVGGRDPHIHAGGVVMVDAACERPHWYSTVATEAWSLPSGTSGNTSTFEHPGSPGAVAVWPRWTLNGPGTWILPDRSYGQEEKFGRAGEDDSAKTYTVVTLLADEDVAINADPNQPFMHPLAPWMRSNGQSLIYPVKKWTAPHNVTVSVSGATAGVTATLFMDQLFDTPFGRSI